ncbi:hypothetical protein CRP143_gp11 [Roseobacter phage CRP-143]|nr:hypothetical protein CRP143_gp11 [Roseobacter phage CRP-143]
MSIWVDLYVVENEEGQWYELFGDEVTADQYVENINSSLRKNSPPLRVRHTIVDIED